jgi:hypothetical protein
VEFFGGDVNCTNLVVAYCGDDAFDMDQGFHGKGQFWLGINSTDSDKCMEVTGGIEPVPSLPGNFPLIYNVTLIGNTDSEMKPAVHFLDYGGGAIRNSILLEPGLGIGVYYTVNPGDSYGLFHSGRLSAENNILYPGIDPVPRFFTYDELGTDLSSQNLIMADSLAAWETDYSDPGISLEDGMLPPNTVFDNLAPYEHQWFDEVTFKGAFGSNNWIEGWTLLHESLYES